MHAVTLTAVTEPYIPPQLPGPAIDVQAAALQHAIMDCTARGWILQQTGPGMAVMRSGQGSRTNHVLHALLSLFTCGLWLIVWLLIALFSGSNTEKTLLIAVDQLGNVTYQPGRQ